MITNFKKHTRKDDMQLLAWIVIGFLFVAWLCTPPGNKFLQICFWGNNTKFMLAKVMNNSDTTAYKFYRNNAIYLAKMYPNKTRALKEMDKSIQSYPSYLPDSELKKLYKDRAYIKMYAGDYKGALNDFISSEDIVFQDYLKVALLYKEAGLYKQAMSYCNAILNQDSTAYAGFACLSDIYDSAGRPDVSIKIWTLALDRRPNNARAYADRALLRKKIGDMDGYRADVAKAQEYQPNINLEQSIVEETLHPKILTLTPTPVN